LQRDAEGISARHPKEVTRMALGEPGSIIFKKKLGRYVSWEVDGNPSNEPIVLFAQLSIYFSIAGFSHSGGDP
jgi:hypothetical protein